MSEFKLPQLSRMKWNVSREVESVHRELTHLILVAEYNVFCLFIFKRTAYAAQILSYGYKVHKTN